MDDNNRLLLPVKLTMMDGEKLEGEMILTIGGAIERTINNEARFILFTDNETGERYLSKTAIKEVVPVKNR